MGCGGSLKASGTVSDGGADGSDQTDATEGGNWNASETSHDWIPLADPAEAAVDAWHCFQLNESCIDRPSDCCQSQAALSCIPTGMGAICSQPFN